MATNKPKTKQKDDSGSKPGEKGKAKAKPRIIKVTAVDTIDFGINPAFAAMEKPEQPKAQTEEKPEELRMQTMEKPEEPKMQTVEKPEEQKSQTVEKPEEPKTQTVEKPKPAPKKPTVPGVRAMRTRPYLAGTIVAKYGLAAGVTDAMVAELDQAYDKPNPIESRICLKNAHHAARGYLGVAEGAVK